ncbi:MAG: hypothetical protein R2712_31605 [Vicinamibacterales bacterium]
MQQLPAQMQVIASLFRAADAGAVVSSVRLDRATDDLLASQRDAAGEIVRAFASPLKAAARRPPERIEAENAYRRGLYHWKQCFSGGWEQALQQYKLAIEHEPEFVEAHVAEAAVYNFLGYYCVMRPKLAFQVARQASLRALEVDDRSAPAHLECRAGDAPEATGRGTRPRSPSGRRSRSRRTTPSRTPTTHGSWCCSAATRSPSPRRKPGCRWRPSPG